VEDVAREAGVSRATVYRHVPGGRDQLVEEAIAWETQNFFRRLAEAVAGLDSFAAVLEEGLLRGHRAVREHAVLQRLLATEPGRLLPTLTVEASRLVPAIATFLRPFLARERLRPGVDLDDAAEYVARMVLSHVNAQGRWDLDDREQVKTLVRTEFLAGVTDVTDSGP
jgi:AcrR family transcriptional regulator